MRIYTLGTADRSEAEIAKILSKYQIQVMADIRRTVRSPLPHLKRDSIQRLCQDSKVEYLYLGNELGSEREQGRVDNLDPALYQRGLTILKSLARTRGLLILCSERTPEKCTRRLIAQTLAADGAEVFHLLGVEELWAPSKTKPRPDNRPQGRFQENRNRGFNKPRRAKRREGRGTRDERFGFKKRTGHSKMDKTF